MNVSASEAFGNTLKNRFRKLLQRRLPSATMTFRIRRFKVYGGQSVHQPRNVVSPTSRTSTFLHHLTSDSLNVLVIDFHPFADGKHPEFR